MLINKGIKTCNVRNSEKVYDYSYYPKELPDDEQIRKNINDQINYVRIFFIFRLKISWIKNELF